MPVKKPGKEVIALTLKRQFLGHGGCHSSAKERGMN